MSKKSTFRKTLVVASVCLLTVLALVSAGLTQNRPAAEKGQLSGRDFSQMGTRATFSGTLQVDQAGEWYLQTSKSTYALHLGPEGFRAAQGFQMKKGEKALVKGFLYNNDVAVAEIETGGRTIILRDSTGRPAWSGTGYSQRRNMRPGGQGKAQGPGLGQGRGYQSNS